MFLLGYLFIVQDACAVWVLYYLVHAASTSVHIVTY